MKPYEKADPPVIKLAILASGGGSNARKICEHLKGQRGIEVGAIISNKSEAGVRQHAQAFNIPFVYHPNEDFTSGEKVMETLKVHHISGVVLAGFLRKIPSALLRAYPDKVLNIHPALLPKYGGKGMYGHHVHKAVKESGDNMSGPTIHLVNEQYDDGKVLFQAKVGIEPDDTAEDIGAKVLKLEHTYYPRIIESYFLGLKTKS